VRNVQQFFMPGAFVVIVLSPNKRYVLVHLRLRYLRASGRAS
jgi:hypothetical protein